MEFNDGFPQYEILAHHSEEEGKVKRKKLWRVFWIMLAITILELIIGLKAEAWGLLDAMKFSTVTLKLIFVFLTIVKAGYIVLSFMHLGDERKSLKYTILVPYVLFVLYLTWIILVEGTYSMSTDRKAPMNQLIIDQQYKLRTQGSHGHDAAEHAAPAAAGENSEDKNAHEKKQSH